MRNRMVFVLLALAVVVLVSCIGDRTASAAGPNAEEKPELIVRYVSEFTPETHRKLVHWAILDLVLKKSGRRYDLDVVSYEGAPARAAHMVSTMGNIRGGRASSIRLNEELEPVRIPVFRGLLSYWNLWVKSGDLSRFADVRNIRDLSRFSVLQGRWPSAALLEDEGFSVRVGRYHLLPNMLAAGRADILPYPIMETAVMFGDPSGKPGLTRPITRSCIYRRSIIIISHREKTICVQRSRTD
ncbi:MAG: hypothetical protein R3C97_03285 [Geminicoccaceae bacterium]